MLQDLTLAVFGPGLLGGSLLMDARALGVREIRAWARRPEAVADLERRGLADFASVDAAEVARGADFLVLATPVGAMEGLARAMEPGIDSPDAVVTDVGSVKAAVLRGAGRVFREAGVAFVGSHPMAGSENNGLGAAQAGLFRGAPCLITPEEDSREEDVRRVEDFWRALGAAPSCVDAAQHDRIVARVSHLPHLAAALVTIAALRDEPGVAEFAAGGLRDTTRVAAGDPGMWCEIVTQNREAILPALTDLHRITGELLEVIRCGDGGALLQCLEDARRLRATRYP